MSSDLVEHLRDMLSSGVFLDPLLANNYLKNAGDTDGSNLQQRAHEMSERLYEQFVSVDRVPTDGLVDKRPFSPSLLRLAFYETLLSTAVFIAHEETGVPQPSEAALQRAGERLQAFLRKVGPAVVYNVYMLIAGHDAMQPLSIHKDVTETEFLTGIRHYPYFPQNLELFLMFGLAAQNMRLKRVGTERMVQLTRAGHETYQKAREVMRASGYFGKRVQFAYLYQFDHVEDWDEMCDVVWPTNRLRRQEYLEFVGDFKGKRVLEVACGTGVITFDTGLYERVGPTGQLTALDISSGMLDQAQRKLDALGNPPYIKLQLGNVEKMPFPDASFDICLGVGFIHFVDPVVTLREMARTVVPGGIVSIFQGTRFALDGAFFRDWFEPIFALARRRNAEQPSNYMPADCDTLVRWFEQAGLKDIDVYDTQLEWVFDNPEIVVQHIVRGVSFFEEELMQLPWDDRKAIVLELIDRGRDVCARYPLAQRIIHCPMYGIRGIVR
ncbi:class I SAM-dependent methyltransferase [Alicyclobacillus cycloheptanicus]|uniref:Ubiquinone/menaquinone biosynthesis C-methylase UbiE n=1 Tax=Alicyclobacillus cycloheptanicus TaxID=1457 RepID=A0ABT9XED2_9BACL|nr:class I SAM-dependent methyltransferase [Alicyclobacillus cycloheptanicus]MDQ0188653.1 ubiquinone/menaquinone biosynthesis C-methylase UbiE [Alicyclobacillus cycloheptanicus]WDM00672.1 class I SAM-dependent methyltransferase [Alicyclobacillus cycloheptanicus]